jgi:hypothetical protein
MFPVSAQTPPAPAPADQTSPHAPPTDAPSTVAPAPVAGIVAAGQPPVQVRVGEHGEYTRVVFVLPPGMTFHQTRAGDLLILNFPGAGKVPGVKPPPANILSVNGGLNVAALGISQGTRVHVWQLDQRVIVDVYATQTAADPAPQQPVQPAPPTSLALPATSPATPAKP